MKQFIEKYFTIIVFVLLIFTFFKGCNDSRELTKVKNEVLILQKSVVTKTDLNLINDAIKIEGLKVEKRMIQSTDRKIMDVNRQSEIDKELKLLENK